MEYKVVPFVVSTNCSKGSSNFIANQLEVVIKKYSSEGWKYVRLERISIYIQPKKGFFRFGGKQGYNSSRQMLVFKK